MRWLEQCNNNQIISREETVQTELENNRKMDWTKNNCTTGQQNQINTLQNTLY